MKIVKKPLRLFIVIAIGAAVFIPVFMFIMCTRDVITAKDVAVYGLLPMLVIFLIVALTRGKLERLINKEGR